MQAYNHRRHRRAHRHLARLAIAVALAGATVACAHRPARFQPDGAPVGFSVGTIVSAKTGKAIAKADMIMDLASADVVYVGESHTDPEHHRVQKILIEALYDQRPDLAVGMEMFDRTYQPILDQWSEGRFEWPAFLAATHWYANWRYPDRLYADILTLIRTRGIPLIGLNIAFHLPPKIAVGGLDSLRDWEKMRLPDHIDLTRAAHRAFVKTIFESHHLPGRTFENFYAAQCVWEDTMAETISWQPAGRLLVVLTGTGHIADRYGIPDRAKARTGRNDRIVIPITAGRTASLSAADYFWVTAPADSRHPSMQ